MLAEEGVVDLALKPAVTRNFSDRSERERRIHCQLQTFSRSGTGLKIRFQLLPELNSDMLNTSMGLWRRGRARNHFRDFL